MKKILETQRLCLREMTYEDYADLCEILQDEKTMYAYEHAFSDEEAREWLDRQLGRYENDGFGLWAVIDKKSGVFLGQCGITWQDCGGDNVPEIGYLFKRKYWHNGYASEAACGCREYAFNKLGFDKIYSIIRDNNYASQKVAERNNMKTVKMFVKHYYGMDMLHLVYCAERNKI
ncbi:MAG: GNAT family N-acetyltransferase [Clostridia bacterium]|jgi:ribosomal-protein-alanine N-acetyltransferase|nr:GNAT family N-acetyltransferase [Clostridia bacterium]